MNVAAFEDMRAAHADGFHVGTADPSCVFCARADTEATADLNRRLVEENAELVGRLVALRAELQQVKDDLEYARMNVGAWERTHELAMAELTRYRKALEEIANLRPDDPQELEAIARAALEGTDRTKEAGTD